MTALESIRRRRRGAVVVMTAFCMVILIGMVAFAVDLGFVVLVRTELQAAADSAVLAASATMSDGPDAARAIAKKYAADHWAGGAPVTLADTDVEFGIWDDTTRTFTPTVEPNNAVRVTARRDAGSAEGEATFFFGRIFGEDRFPMTAQAIAMANPRDIAFVVDLSGSMNDDTEPSWATQGINNAGFEPGLGNDLVEKVYNDFGFGPFPGPIEHIGEPLGVRKDNWAYAEMTKDDGPLAGSVSAAYRILSTDDEHTRKRKAYSWIIDNQIARLMPAALPTPDSTSNYDYWAKYIDYVVRRRKINYTPPGEEDDDDDGGSSSGGGSSSPPPSSPPPSNPPPPSPPPPPKPPAGFLLPDDLLKLRQYAGHAPLPTGRAFQPAARIATRSGWDLALFSSLLVGSTPPPGTPPNIRGTIPPGVKWSEQITRYNNPNKSLSYSSDGSKPSHLFNKIGYLTYVAFMMDHGRNGQPDGVQHVPLSVESPYCPLRPESTPGGTFLFPPRSQPMHAARRAMIAAIAHVKTKNENIPGMQHRDWVSIISYDLQDGNSPRLEQGLTGNYDQAMLATTELQAVRDVGATTATEAGLARARQHLRPSNQGGQGRSRTDKVVILLTDGVPNLWQSAKGDIDAYIGNNPDPDADASTQDFYGGGYYWFDAALMQVNQMKVDNDWYVYPVGIGAGTDYDFMDRMARMGGTASSSGQSTRSSGNPADYEQKVYEIFKEIIDRPQVRIVE